MLDLTQFTMTHTAESPPAPRLAGPPQKSDPRPGGAAPTGWLGGGRRWADLLHGPRAPARNPQIARKTLARGVSPEVPQHPPAVPKNVFLFLPPPRRAE